MDHIIFYLVGVFVILIGVIYFQGCEMSHPERMLKTITDGLKPKLYDEIRDQTVWLESVGLKFCTSFEFGPIQFVVYQHGNQSRFLSFMCQERVSFCAESYFENMNLLDTSNCGSLGLYPCPGRYMQSFPRIPLQELWENHLEGEIQLIRKFGLRVKANKGSYEQDMMEGIRAQMAYNRSLSFWPFRVLYRFFVTRHTFANKPITKQFP